MVCTLVTVVQHCITYRTPFANTLQLRYAVCAHRVCRLLQVVVARWPSVFVPCLQIRVGRFDSGPRLHLTNATVLSQLHFLFATHFCTLATHFAPRKTYAARCLTYKHVVHVAHSLQHRVQML